MGLEGRGACSAAQVQSARGIREAGGKQFRVGKAAQLQLTRRMEAFPQESIYRCTDDVAVRGQERVFGAKTCGLTGKEVASGRVNLARNKLGVHNHRNVVTHAPCSSIIYTSENQYEATSSLSN